MTVTDTAETTGQPVPTLDLDAIRQRWLRTGADCDFQVEECRCADNPHDNALHDLAVDDVPALLAEVERLAEENARLTVEVTAGLDSEQATVSEARRLTADLADARAKVQRVEAWYERTLRRDMAHQVRAALAGEGATEVWRKTCGSNTGQHEPNSGEGAADQPQGEPSGCPETVWDGPYSFPCQKGGETGNCPRHGVWR